MTSLRLAIPFLCALLAAACSTAPSSPATAASGSDGVSVPPAQTVAATEEEDPIICETVMRTGTRVAKRFCARRSELEKQQQAANEMLGEVQRRSTISTISNE